MLMTSVLSTTEQRSAADVANADAAVLFVARGNARICEVPDRGVGRIERFVSGLGTPA